MFYEEIVGTSLAMFASLRKQKFEDMIGKMREYYFKCLTYMASVSKEAVLKTCNTKLRSDAFITYKTQKGLLVRIKDVACWICNALMQRSYH